MERHETLVLEEPSAPGFPGMLNGRLSVDDYLLEIDSEFPRFDRLMCGLLMEFHGMGRRIIQVEPYLERLIEIHERFAELSFDDCERLFNAIRLLKRNSASQTVEDYVVSKTKMT